MITIDATGATSGIDFEAFIRGGFLAGAPPTGYPPFNNDPMAFAGEEVFFNYGAAASSKYVLGHGNFSYDISTHIVSGAVNTIEFGTRGSGSFDSNGYFSGGNSSLEITGLSLSGAAFNAFIAAYMAGAGADPTALNTFADALDTGPQHFKGSAFDDVYTGTTFSDLIDGGAGNDRLGSGGGNDDIDGGDGEDTAIFSGVESAYAVTRYDNGLITVRKDSETTTLRNVEKLEFGGGGSGSVDVAVLPQTALARATIDASAMNGVNFTTYIADYFAKLQLSGSSAFHGGVPDIWFPGGPNPSTDYLNGDQVSFKFRASGFTSGDYTSVVVLEGQEIAYDRAHYWGGGPPPTGQYPHGSISGSIDKIIFGAITGAQPSSGPDLYTGYTAELVISGLGIHDDPGAGGNSSTNPVPSLYYGVNTGNVAKIEGVLSNYAFDFIGSGGGDFFVGGLFDDIIDGGLGNDLLSGERGDDAISGGQGDDVLSGGFGNDSLVGGAGNDGLKGDEGDDLLNGDEGDDVLFGGDGNDVLDGGDGHDILRGDDGGDLLVGGEGLDLLEGGAGDDQLIGGAHKDVLRGGEGDDILIGGKAKDKLFGDEGADTFVFRFKGDSGVKKALRDTIRDFSSDEGDKIDLSFKKGLSFIGKDGFSGDGGEVRYTENKAITVVKVDLNGDASVDMKIALSGKVNLAEGDFIL